MQCVYIVLDKKLLQKTAQASGRNINSEGVNEAVRPIKPPDSCSA